MPLLTILAAVLRGGGIIWFIAWLGGCTLIYPPPSFSLTSSGLYRDENPQNDSDDRHGDQQMPNAETPMQPRGNARVNLSGQFQLLKLQISNLDEQPL